MLAWGVGVGVGVGVAGVVLFGIGVEVGGKRLS